jgi:hypothetical protein
MAARPGHGRRYHAPVLPPASAALTTRLQLALFALAAAAMVALTVHATACSPVIAWVGQGGRGLWIAAPHVPSSQSIGHPRAEVPVSEFRRSFRVEDSGAPLRLSLWALRSFELELNGEGLAQLGWEEGDRRSWKRGLSVDVGPALRAGRNELRVRVRNPIGPALLRVEAEPRDWDLDSDGRWTVEEGGEEAAAVAADDTRPVPDALAAPRLGSVLADHWQMLAGLFAAGCLLSGALRSRFAGRLPPRLPLLVFAGLALVWGALLLARAIRLPVYMGFDGPQHLEYVHTVLERARLPLADEGGIMYHPPLFYALSAGLLALFRGASEVVVLRVVTFASGLAQIAAAYLLARRLFPGDAARTSLAAACAGLLPVNLYMSCYLGNEPLHGALAGFAILVTVGLLLERGLPARRLVLLGVLLGLAILAKLTSIALVPVAGGFLVWKSDFADRVRPRVTLARVGLAAGVLALVCGWFFVRNQLAFGTPVVGNWNVPGSDRVWWQDPGFHTAGYYAAFGAVLVHPFLAGFRSFLDGIYSTFWGDGLIGGVVAWRHRHALWSYDWMTLVYALALPASAFGIGGALLLARDSLRGSDARRRLALCFVVLCAVAIGFAVFYLNLVHPAYGMTKASYALPVAAPLAVFGAHGALALRRRLAASPWPWLVVPLDGWGATLAAAIVLAFLG